MRYKMVMFDMDGTIIDSYKFHTKVFRKFLWKFGVCLEIEEIGGLIGNTLKHILSKTLAEEKHDEALEYLSEFYMYHVDDLIRELVIIEGAVDVLESIRREAKLALVTNSKSELVERILAIKALDHLFDDVVAADKESLDKKSRCTGLFNKHGVQPSEVLYVGDSSHDVILSKELGMDCCLINNETSWINKANFHVEGASAEYEAEDIKECLRYCCMKPRRDMLKGTKGVRKV